MTGESSKHTGKVQPWEVAKRSPPEHESDQEESEWKMSSNTHKIPETTGKQPLKEGELICYKCGQKGHMQPQCPKLRN